MSRGFLFDVNKCTGCHACRLACAVENDLPWGESWRNIHGFNPENDPGLPLFHLSLACNHCDDAPCMASCPALAYRRDEATGAVLIDEDHCIGCKYCSWACPYDAPLYSPATDVMTKCTLCQPRLVENRDPACVAYCPTGALAFGELDRAEGSSGSTAAKYEGALSAEGGTGAPSAARRRDRTAPGFAEHDIGPRVRFTPLHDERWPAAGASPEHVAPPAGGRRLSLKTEWPLAVFTLLAAVSVSVFSGAVLAERPVSPFAWLIPGAAGMGVSLLHLGKKSRAWRAVLNLRRSWVSREIFGFSLFLALAAAGTPTLGAVRTLEWPAIYIGFFALLAMDRVYSTTRRPERDRFHSAEVLDTGLYLAGWLAGWPWLAGVIGLYKLVLFFRRKSHAARAGEPTRTLWSTLRVVLGFAVPLGLALDRPEAWPYLAFAAALAGEVIDRFEFYVDFRLNSPRADLDAEYRRRLPDSQPENPTV